MKRTATTEYAFIQWGAPDVEAGKVYPDQPDADESTRKIVNWFGTAMPRDPDLALVYRLPKIELEVIFDSEFPESKWGWSIWNRPEIGQIRLYSKDGEGFPTAWSAQEAAETAANEAYAEALRSLEKSPRLLDEWTRRASVRSASGFRGALSIDWEEPLSGTVSESSGDWPTGGSGGTVQRGYVYDKSRGDMPSGAPLYTFILTETSSGWRMRAEDGAKPWGQRSTESMHDSKAAAKKAANAWLRGRKKPSKKARGSLRRIAGLVEEIAGQIHKHGLDASDVRVTNHYKKLMQTVPIEELLPYAGVVDADPDLLDELRAQLAPHLTFEDLVKHLNRYEPILVEDIRDEIMIWILDRVEQITSRQLQPADEEVRKTGAAMRYIALTRAAARTGGAHSYQALVDFSRDDGAG